MLTTTMSSEEVTGDTSLIFDIIARGKSRPMDGLNGHHRRRKAIRVCIDINSDNGCNRGTWLERREVIIGRKGDLVGGSSSLEISNDYSYKRNTVIKNRPSSLVLPEG